MKFRYLIASSLLAATLVGPSYAADQQKNYAPAHTNTAFDQMVDRMVAREAENQKALEKYNPVVETYLQNLTRGKEVPFVPVSDDYFIGRVTFKNGVRDNTMMKQPLLRRVFGEMNASFNDDGFAQMVVIDSKGFDRNHYNFDYAGREFLGELRCIVLDVTPRGHGNDPRFIGRVWVEDQGYNIVRFNGTYKGGRGHDKHYSHFDTWRLNMQPDVWLPAYVYTQETGKQFGAKKVTFKAQTRIWGYDVGRTARQNEFTDVQVDTADSVKDQSDNVQDLSPVASQRMWQRQSEDNVLDRLERAGLIAKAGEVDRVLDTVINNLEITNKIAVAPEARARVLMTAPIESFTIGNTIVISRGLLDVLPDEASLAAVLAHELAHIALAHPVNTDWAYSDETIFPDAATLRKLNFTRPQSEEAAADAKALEFLQNSPYQAKLANVGLFLRQLQSSRGALPHLIRANVGNSMTLKNDVRLAALQGQAPALEPKKLEQIAALPLGGRIKVNPWSDKIEMTKNKPVALVSPNEKMPFEVTPLFPYLTRNAPDATAPKSAAAPAANDAAPESQLPAAEPVSNNEDQPAMVPTTSSEQAKYVPPAGSKR